MFGSAQPDTPFPPRRDALGEPESTGDRVRQQLRVAQRGQLNPADAVRVAGGGRLRGAPDDAGLADPARPDKRNQSRIAQQSVDLA